MRVTLSSNTRRCLVPAIRLPRVLGALLIIAGGNATPRDVHAQGARPSATPGRVATAAGPDAVLARILTRGKARTLPSAPAATAPGANADSTAWRGIAHVIASGGSGAPWWAWQRDSLLASPFAAAREGATLVTRHWDGEGATRITVAQVSVTARRGFQGTQDTACGGDGISAEWRGWAYLLEGVPANPDDGGTRAHFVTAPDFQPTSNAAHRADSLPVALRRAVSTAVLRELIAVQQRAVEGYAEELQGQSAVQIRDRLLGGTPTEFMGRLVLHRVVDATGRVLWVMPLEFQDDLSDHGQNSKRLLVLDAAGSVRQQAVGEWTVLAVGRFGAPVGPGEEILFTTGRARWSPDGRLILPAAVVPATWC